MEEGKRKKFRNAERQHTTKVFEKKEKKEKKFSYNKTQSTRFCPSFPLIMPTWCF